MRKEQRLVRGWRFCRGEQEEARLNDFDDSGWECVRVPHDWAIAGPFDRENDPQYTRILQDGERCDFIHYGRTGGLPHVGVGWYRLKFRLPGEGSGRTFRLEFDGVMSHSQVFINGVLAGGRPYGYCSFAVDASPYLKPGEENLIAVRVENFPAASRWYPGAGIYRDVRLVELGELHFTYNGVWIRTLKLDLEKRSALLRVEATCSGGKEAHITIEVNAPDGGLTGFCECECQSGELVLEDLQLWSPDSPRLYRVNVALFRGAQLCDRLEFQYGFREVRFDANCGMFLNGNPFRMNGVCLHHDLGPLGAAFSEPALRRNFHLLKSIGCNALRTCHNPPSPRFLELADRMGFVVIDEAFDCWAAGKVDHDYSCDYPEWHERDLSDMIRRDRNHPSVVLWSIGNEINEQGIPGGAAIARELADLCRKLGPDHPVTAGFDRPDEGILNGLPDEVDVIGWNYKSARYREFHNRFPDKPQYGSETASTVSTRGYFDFPVRTGHVIRPDFQCGSFDTEYPGYASSPDQEFVAQDASPWIAGEFVWTGFDYLGEPSPYNEDWPSRSAYYGIFDLAGLAKDRAFLYRARWTDQVVLHLLPHWNWPDRIGKAVPVHVYTNCHEVELLLNGKSQGRCRRAVGAWRIVWDDVLYTPGELVGIGRDDAGREVIRSVVRTAGAVVGLRLTADRSVLFADGDDLAFVSVEAIDCNGNLQPLAAVPVRFDVNGGELAGVCNGDPTSLESLQGDRMTTFFGKCVAVVRSLENMGDIILRVSSPGISGAELHLIAVDGKSPVASL